MKHLKVKDKALIMMAILLGAALVGAMFGGDFLTLLSAFSAFCMWGILGSLAFGEYKEPKPEEKTNE